MSVLIRKMKMPKNCERCDLSTWEGFPLGDLKLVCQLLGQVDNIENRDEDCPLIEVPTPHGRLIDADILTERFENLTAQALDYTKKLNEQEGNHELWRIWSTLWAERSAYMHDLYDEPTVIEAENSN